MKLDFETLLEQVLTAVMDSQAEPLTILWKLRQSAPDARVTMLIRALLATDQVIASTFSGSTPDRADAKLARTMALILAEAADDAEQDEAITTPLQLSDLSI